MHAMSEMWNSVAPGWEANAEFVDSHLQAATEALLDAAAVAAGEDVLELGSGPGGAGLAAAARVGPSGTVVLSDVAAEMIEVAARRAAASPNVSTAVFDQSDIPGPEARFDAVICRHGLMFAEDPAHAVREAVRVLRPGGRYATMTWGPRAENPWLGATLDAVGEQFGVPFPPPNVRGPFSLGDSALLKSVLEDGGLQDVRVERVDAAMRVPSVEAWWERIPKLAGPLAMALEGMEPDVRDAIAQRARGAATASAHREGDQVVFAGSVLIGAGHKPER
jgi:ubiquinone/menaquinone biosynthesis C-methylase UbiE